MRDRRLAEAAGRRGERIAAWWLRLKGWRVLDTRVRTPAGEVDLVAGTDGTGGAGPVARARPGRGNDHPGVVEVRKGQQVGRHR